MARGCTRHASSDSRGEAVRARGCAHSRACHRRQHTKQLTHVEMMSALGNHNGHDGVRNIAQHAAAAPWIQHAVAEHDVGCCADALASPTACSQWAPGTGQPAGIGGGRHPTARVQSQHLDITARTPTHTTVNRALYRRPQRSRLYAPLLLTVGCHRCHVEWLRPKHVAN